MKLRNKLAIAGLVVALALTVAGFSCNQAKSAAVATNRYVESLSSFQDAAAKEHDNGKIDDAVYANILKSEGEASVAARHLDSAILLANSGGDFAQYTDAAQSSFNDLVSLLPSVSDPVTQQALKDLAAITAGLLKDAVILIHQIKPAPVKPQAPAGLWILGAFGLIGMAAGAGGAGGATAGILGALAVIKEIADMEPIVLQFILNIARSMKGMSTEEVVAMSEKTLDKIDETIKSEQAKLDAKKGVK